jgi:hypothetical protein
MPDPFQTLNAIRQALDVGATLQWFVVSNVHMVFDALRAFVFRTGNPLSPSGPFISVQPIQSFTPLVQVAADGGLTLVITYAGFRMMWSRTTTRSQFVLRVLLPRVLLAAILINFTLPLIQTAVDGSNALSDSVVIATGHAIVTDVRSFVNDLGYPGLQFVTMIVLFGAYTILAFAYLIRFSLLVILTILAPAAALLFVLPETHHYARQWGALFIGALLMQPLQLLILAIGFALDGTSALPLRHLFALSAVFIAFKVPAALHSTSLASTKATGFSKRTIRHAVRLVTKA